MGDVRPGPAPVADLLGATDHEDQKLAIEVSSIPGSPLSAQGGGRSPRPGSPASPLPALSLEERRAQQEEREYRRIYDFMQKQILYQKRRVARREVGMQTDLVLPLEPLDETSLLEVCEMLCEEWRRSYGGTVDIAPRCAAPQGTVAPAQRPVFASPPPPQLAAAGSPAAPSDPRQRVEKDLFQSVRAPLEPANKAELTEQSQSPADSSLPLSFAASPERGMPASPGVQLGLTTVESCQSLLEESAWGRTRNIEDRSWGERTGLLQSIHSLQSASQEERLRQEHQAALAALEARLKASFESEKEDLQKQLRSEATTNLKKAELAWKQKEDQLMSEKMKAAAVAKYEISELGSKAAQLDRRVQELTAEKAELEDSLEAYEVRYANLQRDHLEFHLTEKERSVEQVARMAATTTSLVEALQKKQRELQKAESADLLSRLGTTFSHREALLQRSAENAYAKLEALQRDYLNLQKVHAHTSEMLSRAFSEKIVINTPEPKRVANELASRGRGGVRTWAYRPRHIQVVPPAKPMLSASLTTRPVRPASRQKRTSPATFARNAGTACERLELSPEPPEPSQPEQPRPPSGVRVPCLATGTGGGVSA